MHAILAPIPRPARCKLFAPTSVFIFLQLFALHSLAGQANLAWDVSPDSRVTGYNVHFGVQSGNYTLTYPAGNVTSTTVTGLTEGKTYYFAVRARDASGSESANSNQVSATIPTGAPAISISATPTSGSAPLAVAFSSTVSEATSYTWNFGDNITSANVRNPSHTYSAPGTYTARLSATGPGGTVTQSKTITVTAPSNSGGNTNAPQGAIVSPSSPVKATTGKFIYFSGSGSGGTAPLSYSWSFGDGRSLARKNPAVYYGKPGTYSVKLTVRDAKGVADPTPATVTVIVSGPTSNSAATAADASSASVPSSSSAPAPVAPRTIAGLVAAYGFNEGTGGTVGDSSGKGNSGVVSNATWVTSGRFGKALRFSGNNSIVSVRDAPSLRLTSAMTLEAWVNPSALSSAWRDVIYKGYDDYYLEATSTANSVPAGGYGSAGAISYDQRALAAGAWTHLAVTYDGTSTRLYVNGIEKETSAGTGNIQTSTKPLQIGGDSDWGQYFAGLIDEVRIYNRALSGADIQADMNTPVS